MGPTTEAVREKLAAIEAEMRRVGIWEVATPDGPPIGAFGGGNMAFEQWLRHVFVPNVQALVASDGPWPAESQVAQQAYREWRMHGDWAEAEPLIDALRAFDALFGGS
jgi:uncharacterized protein YqcC (DUF446 family)